MLAEAAKRRSQPVGALIREAVARYVAAPSREEKQQAVDWMARQSEPAGSPEEIKAEIIAAIDGAIEETLEAD